MTEERFGASLGTLHRERVYPLDPQPQDFDIRDIANALSKQCRFSGHTSKFYSVAEHSVRVSRGIEKDGGSIEDQLWGLLHDASEAYLVDMPRPLKHGTEFGKFYRNAEEGLMYSLVLAFKLNRTEPACVKEWDDILLNTEARDLGLRGPYSWWNGRLEPKISPWSPTKAYEEFLTRYYLLEFGR